MSWSPTAVLDELAAPREIVRVLLVEDNPGDARLVEEMLRDSPDDTILTTCDRLAAAEEPIGRGLADLVLLDLSLPDSDGLDGVRRLRTAAPEVPVVVLSGLTDEQVALEAVQAGAQDYLMKGEVDGPSLSRAMRYALERQKAERRLARMALRDPLTGLPNRILFADRLEQALARGARVQPEQDGRRAGGHLVLMFVDLDGFKEVNDRFGHHCGDEVLQEVARRLRLELRHADTVSRLGGDEFTVLCEGVADDAAAQEIAQRINEALARPYEVTPDGSATVTAAIGIAVAAFGDEDAGALLRRADAAMYEAKRAGAGRFAMADPA